jgi:hypothetical protein
MENPGEIGDAPEACFFNNLTLGHVGGQQQELSFFNSFSDNKLTWRHADQ